MLNKIDKKDYYIKDPIHKEVDFKKDKWLVELIQTKEFVRLEGMYQLGVSYKIFPSATHNRLMHSLGTYQVAKKFADFFEKEISQHQRKLFLVSALLHDIGHGPFSHVFESLSKISHEEITKKIILNKKGEIYNILVKNGINPQEVIDIYECNSKYEWISRLISSNLDVDRIDYMLRDSYFIGTHYGTIDIDYLIERSYLVSMDIYFSDKTINVIESFLLARYYMHEDIFSNKNTYIYEWVLSLIIHRVKEIKSKFILNKQKISFSEIYDDLILKEKEIDLDKFLEYTDWSLVSFISSLKILNDNILNSLINCFIYHKDVVALNYSDELLNECIKLCKSKNLPEKYIYKVVVKSSKKIYSKEEKDTINIINSQTKKISCFDPTKFEHFNNKKDKENKFILINEKLIN